MPNASVHSPAFTCVSRTENPTNSKHGCHPTRWVATRLVPRIAGPPRKTATAVAIFPARPRRMPLPPFTQIIILAPDRPPITIRTPNRYRGDLASQCSMFFFRQQLNVADLINLSGSTRVHGTILWQKLPWGLMRSHSERTSGNSATSSRASRLGTRSSGHRGVPVHGHARHSSLGDFCLRASLVSGMSSNYRVAASNRTR